MSVEIQVLDEFSVERTSMVAQTVVLDIRDLIAQKERLMIQRDALSAEIARVETQIAELNNAGIETPE